MHEGLLIHGGALGDFVMSLRVVAALHKSGAERVTMLGRGEYAALARHGGVDEYLDLSAGGYHALFSDEAALSGDLTQRLARFDIAVDMLAGSESPLHRRLQALGIARVLSIDPRQRPRWRDHITDQWMDDLRAAGLNATAEPPRIALDRVQIDAARRQLLNAAGPDHPIAVIHPGSGSRDKCWPVESFLELIDSLRAQRWGVVVLMGPVEAERFAAATMARLRATATVFENRPLDEIAALIGAADLFIGNDSGVSHLAAAVGTPTLAIFGPTDPRLWRPLGDGVIVVRSDAGSWPDLGVVLDATVAMSLNWDAP